MKFDDIPDIIQEVIKIRTTQQGNSFNPLVFWHSKEKGGFNWASTPEDYNFWYNVLSQGDFKVFFDKYPLNLKCGIDTKGIAKMDFIHKGNPIKQGRVVNANKFTWPYLCEYDIYMKQFNPSLSEQENNPFNIDYSKSDWWKVLEEGDELIACDIVGSLGKDWSHKIKIGDIVTVVQHDVNNIQGNEHLICFQNNKYGVNFTYNMVKLHKKKNKQLNNNNELQTNSGTIEQSIRTGSINVPGGKCQIANSSRLAGTAKSIVPSPPTTKTGLLSPIQLIRHH